DIFDRALASKPVLSSLDDLVTVLLAKCDFKRRKIDWEDADEDAVLDLRLTFEESLDIFNEAFPKQNDPYFRIEKYYAYILANKLGDADKAKGIWSTLVEKQGLNTEAWIQYILFERDQGNYNICSSLFKQAIQKNIDNPVRLMDVWNTIEHEVGTLDSYEIALIRMNQKTKRLAKQWENQYVQEEKIERNEKEEEARRQEKSILEKKKKSAHRLAQKQKAKEKRAMQRSEFKAPVEMAVNEPETTDNHASHKRKLSADDNDSIEDSKKKFKANRQAPKAPFNPKPRGVILKRGKALNLGRRAVNRSIAPIATKKNYETTEDDKTPKSNEDFRAMLLGGKK
ncbi:MAG: hypothetical protein EXX96DRAFT_473122, partial [Benjaminiella poitrasii]